MAVHFGWGVGVRCGPSFAIGDGPCPRALLFSKPFLGFELVFLSLPLLLNFEFEATAEDWMLVLAACKGDGWVTMGPQPVVYIITLCRQEMQDALHSVLLSEDLVVLLVLLGGLTICVV